MFQLPLARASLVAVLVSCSACKPVDGRYEPACVAYEGETVVLADGLYTLDRFTDERKVGTDGKPLEPFPGYPKTGRVERRGERIELLDGGKVARSFYLLTRDDDIYLLTPDERSSTLESGDLPPCPLRKADNAQN